MKTMKYILMALAAFSLFFTSCTDETFEGEGGKPTAGMVKLNISIPASDIVTPMTKSSQADADEINNLTVLVYGENGYIINGESKYYESVTLTGSRTIALSLPIAAGSKSIHLVANAGDMTSALNTLDDLKAKTFGLDDQKNPQLVVYGCVGTDGSVTVPAAGLSASVEMKRIYSMITVKIDKAGLSPGVAIYPKSVTLKHIPSTGGLIGPNLIDGKSCLMFESDGETFSFDQNHAEHNDSGTPAFFMYENAQPDGTCNANDQTSKTPASLGINPTTDTEAVKADRTCSYIEVEAYVNNENADNETVRYRFFLGSDAYTKFDVMRNTHYQVTLSLTGNGGLKEASWRVETKLLEDFTVEPIYLGYRTGSTNSFKVSDGWTITSITEQGNTEQGSSGLLDINGNTLTATQTNRNGKAYKTILVNITASNGNKTVKKEGIAVHQAIRLVDPIGYFRKYDNTNPVDVDVKQFDAVSKSYQTLNSVGAWTATLITGEGDFTLSTVDGKTTGKEITGTGGAVKFRYTPTAASKGSPKYGVILVKYHNNACQHKIFLRQGYDSDVEMGSSSAKWSLFNMQGNNDRADYPTETGWFFPAGRNWAVHPFSPGYGVADYKNNPITASDNKSLTGWEGDYTTWKKQPQGPCPDGYSIPTDKDYTSLIAATDVYVGFVHDDSSTPGWSYAGDGKISLENTNYCNPAKGTLLVDKYGSAKSLFFSYGKGVLTAHQDESSTPRDEFIETGIDEIGVGYRGAWGSKGAQGLSYSDDGRARYGALYSTSTQNAKDPDNMILADFWYDATDVETSGKNNTGFSLNNADYQGRPNRATFVRCVRRDAPVAKKEFANITVEKAGYGKGTTFDLIFTTPTSIRTTITSEGVIEKITENSASMSHVVTLKTTRVNASGTITLTAEGYETTTVRFQQSGKAGENCIIKGSLYSEAGTIVKGSTLSIQSGGGFVDKVEVSSDGEYTMTLNENASINSWRNKIQFKCVFNVNGGFITRYSEKTPLTGFFSDNPSMTLNNKNSW